MGEKHQLVNSSRGMRLNIELGSPLGLDIAKGTPPFKGNLIGLEPQEYLIVKPMIPKEFEARIQKRLELSVNYHSLGSEYGFQSRVIDYIDSPFKLLFLSYPSEVESLDSRDKARVSCYIPATATLNDRKAKGTITDISMNGCRFIIKLPASLQPRQIMLINVINLAFPIMGMKGIQEFTGKVKNTTIDEEKIAMGIEFTDLDEAIETSIADYITNVTEISSADTSKED